jgi:hypothetical protein
MKSLFHLFVAALLTGGALEAGFSLRGRETAEPSSPGAPVRIAVIGDSTAMGFGTGLRDSLVARGRDVSLDFIRRTFPEGQGSGLRDYLAAKRPDLAVVVLNQGDSETAPVSRPIWSLHLFRVFGELARGWLGRIAFERDRLFSTAWPAIRGPGCARPQEKEFLVDLEIELLSGSDSLTSLGEPLRRLDSLFVRCGADPEVLGTVALVRKLEGRSFAAEWMLHRLRGTESFEGKLIDLYDLCLADHPDEVLRRAETYGADFLRRPPARALLFRAFLAEQTVTRVELLSPSDRARLAGQAWRILKPFSSGLPSPAELYRTIDPAYVNFWTVGQTAQGGPETIAALVALHRLYPGSPFHAALLADALLLHRREFGFYGFMPALREYVRLSPEDFYHVSNLFLFWEQQLASREPGPGWAEGLSLLHELESRSRIFPAEYRIIEENFSAARDRALACESGGPPGEQAACLRKMSDLYLADNARLPRHDKTYVHQAPYCRDYREALMELEERKVPWVAVQNPWLPIDSLLVCLNELERSRAFDVRGALLAEGPIEALFSADHEHLSPQGGVAVGRILAGWLLKTVL